MKQKLQLFTGIFGLFVMLFSFNHCVVQAPKPTVKRKTTSTNNTNESTLAPTATNQEPVDNNQDNIPDDPGGDTTVATNPVMIEEIDQGIKNYEQIYITMSAVTGVNANQSNIKSVYNDLKTQLPNDNNLKSFLAANQVGITKLAAEYCNRLVDDGTLRQNIWPTIDFGRTPAQELGDSNRNLIIGQMLDRFWGPSVDVAVRDMSFLELKTLMADLLAGENQNSSTTTRTVVKGVCIAALSSASITLL